MFYCVSQILLCLSSKKSKLISLNSNLQQNYCIKFNKLKNKLRDIPVTLEYVNILYIPNLSFPLITCIYTYN